MISEERFIISDSILNKKKELKKFIEDTQERIKTDVKNKKLTKDEAESLIYDLRQSFTIW